MSTIAVKNLVLSKSSSTKKVSTIILKGINTDFQSGKINAIMAPNGSGKTTFLNILFGKSDSLTKTSGEILYNGKEREIESWKKEVSFVEQDSFKTENQTVESMIKFAIGMKQKEFKDFYCFLLSGKCFKDFKSLQ